MKEKFATATVLPNGDISVTIPRKTDLLAMWANSGVINFWSRLIKNPECNDLSKGSIYLSSDENNRIVFKQLVSWGHCEPEIWQEWHYKPDNFYAFLRELGENKSVIFEKQPIKIYPYQC